VIDAQALIAQARQWVGVPFRHQGRSRLGCDCLGFVCGVLDELGIPTGLELLPSNYARDPQSKLMDTLQANAREIALEPGALIVVQFPLAKWPSHAAIYTGRNIIHSYQSVGKVVEHIYAEPWVKRTRSVWALPLVTYQ
jgi:cell wall-associated NlpC family hydrolase